jgi:glycosyltransferase involved in cell wall biosynthesis
LADTQFDSKEMLTEEHKAQLVSVVIPCYKQAQFLPEAIESVLSQTYREMEVVVVDDGSPDGTAEVVARYASVRCVRQQNQGQAGARNAGFHATSGEYVVFLDADDRLTPTAVEAHLCCFAEHPEAGFVVGDIDHMALDGSYAGSPRWPMLEANHYEELLKVNHVANTIAVMFRRSVIERVGGFKSSCVPAEDYELLLHAARLFPSAHHRTVVALYRRHTTSVSRKGAVMLHAMHRVMGMQWPMLTGNPRLTTAWRQGERYWRDHFGTATIKQLFAHLRRCELWRAARAFAALLWYVRGRLFVLPWKHRGRVLKAVRHLFGIPQKRADRCPSTIVGR